MIKKLSISDVSSSLKDSDFKYTGKHSRKYFFLQDEALKQIKLCLDHPDIYKHFILTGLEGSGKKNGILSLIRDKYKKSFPVTDYYYNPSDNTISEKNGKAGSIPVFKQKDDKTVLLYESNPNITSLAGVPTENGYIPGSLVQATGGFLVIPMIALLNDMNFFHFLINSLEKNSIDFGSFPELPFYNSYNRSFPNIPIQTRVILIGDEEHYDAMLKLHTRLHNIFKMRVELAYDAYITKKSLYEFSELIDTWQMDSYPPAAPSAKRRLLEYSLSGYDSKQRFPLRLSDLKAVYVEAQVLFAGKKTIAAEEIDIAVENLVARNSSGKIRYFEEIKDGFIKLHLTGERVGRINALSIVTYFNPLLDYGQVNVVSARASIGTGNVLNIERESNLSGDIYDRAIFTLSSYIKGLFHHSFDVDISIMFEQNQAMIDGDSASCAELLAVLSTLADQPIRSNIAVTGSVTQYGDILPVGAINKKIETWHEIISLFGDDNTRYEIFIPFANSHDIILPEDVLKSVRSGKLTLKSYSHINDIIPEIMGIQPGNPDEESHYPEKTLLGKIEHRLERKKTENITS